MRDLSVITAGYIGGSLSDHGNYEKKISRSTPQEVKNLTITHNYYGDIWFVFNFDGGTVGLDSALAANVTDALIAWLESICMGYFEAIFVIDEEGPLKMLRFDSGFNKLPRFTVLSTYHNKKHTKRSIVICDILIDKKDFVKKFYDEILSSLKKTPDGIYEDMNAKAPVRKSAIIEKFLKDKHKQA